MAKPVSPRQFWLISLAVFAAMVVVTLAVFLAVQRAAHHLPGARPDLDAGEAIPGNDADPPTPFPHEAPGR
jgi:hypothetical protein